MDPKRLQVLLVCALYLKSQAALFVALHARKMLARRRARAKEDPRIIEHGTSGGRLFAFSSFFALLSPYHILLFSLFFSVVSSALCADEQALVVVMPLADRIKNFAASTCIASGTLARR